MKPPEELGDVDWTAYEDGWAVPPLIKMLYAGHADFEGNEFHELENHIHRLGVLEREATVLAVPFLAHAAVHSEFFPDRALSLLSRFAETDAWARPAGLEVRAAVVAEAAGLLPCLEFADPALRQLTLQVLAGCAHSLGTDDRPRVAAAVFDVFESDFDRDVTADALTALLLLEDEAAFAPRVEQALAAADPVVRLAGLLCALEAGCVDAVPVRAEYVDEAGRLAARFPGGHFGFPVLGTRQDRAQRAFEALQAVYREGS